MIELIAGALSLSLFGLTVKYAERRSCNLLAVGAVNYAVAAAIHGPMLGTDSPARVTWVLGMVGGVLFVSAYLLLVRVVRLKGIAIPAAVVQLSVLFPVVAGIFMWGEQPGWAQSVGIALALIAMPLLAGGGADEGGRMVPRGMLLTIVLLGVNGGSLTNIQAFHYLGNVDEQRLFFAVLFTTTVPVSALAWWVDRKGSGWQDVVVGMFLGGCNALTGLMQLRAMDTFPGAVVFPFVGSFTLVLTMLVAVRVWGERLGRKGKVGMALALAAVVFINLSRG